MSEPKGWDIFRKFDEETISSKQFEVFQENLKADKELRSNYIKYMRLKNNLQNMANEMTPELQVWNTTIKPKISYKSTFIQYTGWLTAAAAILCMFVLPESFIEKATRDVPTIEQSSKGVAMITKAVDVEWVSHPYKPGQSINSSIVEIKKGVIQLEFYCGATIVMEGPAKIEPLTAWKAICYEGKLRAQVPPAARGFTVKANQTDIVDLGTEFAVNVSAGKADVQVYDGEIELNSDKLNKKSVLAGEALTINENGLSEELMINKNEFLGIQDIHGMSFNQERVSYQSWLEHVKQVKSDKRLIALYDFNQESFTKRILENQSNLGSELNGAIVGTQKANGRWGKKQALSFKQGGDRVRIHIPGDYNSLTFSCWVKIDSLDRIWNSLYLTDDYQIGEPHWQIMGDGRLFFSVKVREAHLNGKMIRSHNPCYSEPFWKPEYSGKWINLAVRLNVEKQTVTHFVNGEQFSHHELQEPFLITTTRFGNGEIGNWGLPNKPKESYAIRNINGAIDELSIYSSALSNEEIKHIFIKGNPY